ncbi:hypothetical protein PR048_026670 [Dryococelus australis]|uniref:Endonuclease/exonuclease/phosphatase domain-containing protein n=1 Tax=Dryococelus australis TaxID=614101 RepID=A0ABQ9GM13_9NEOP|nr:hypothetical protein PR048_026670 [Dryococelus australis]
MPKNHQKPRTATPYVQIQASPINCYYNKGFIPTIPEEVELLDEEGIAVSIIKHMKKKYTINQNKLIVMPLLIVSIAMEQQDKTENLSSVLNANNLDTTAVSVAKRKNVLNVQDHITQTIRTNPFRSNVQTAKENMQATETEEDEIDITGSSEEELPTKHTRDCGAVPQANPRTYGQQSSKLSTIPNKMNFTNNLHKVNEVKLKILLWNANGIKNKDYEFARFLLIEDLDIALITETRLNPTKRLSLPNYSIYRTGRQDYTRGGTAMLIKNNIKHRPIGPKGEFSIIIVPTQMGEMTMAAHYSPPNHKDIEENIQHIVKQAAIFFFIGGDFKCTNPSWGYKTFNKNGRILENMAEHQKFNIYSPPEPTFYKKKTSHSFPPSLTCSSQIFLKLLTWK